MWLADEKATIWHPKGLPPIALTFRGFLQSILMMIAFMAVFFGLSVLFFLLFVYLIPYIIQKV